MIIGRFVAGRLFFKSNQSTVQGHGFSFVLFRLSKLATEVIEVLGNTMLLVTSESCPLSPLSPLSRSLHHERVLRRSGE